MTAVILCCVVLLLMLYRHQIREWIKNTADNAERWDQSPSAEKIISLQAAPMDTAGQLSRLKRQMFMLVNQAFVGIENARKEASKAWETLQLVQTRWMFPKIAHCPGAQI